MRKRQWRLAALFLVMVLLLDMFPVTVRAAGEEWIEISDAAGLSGISSNLSGNYRLTADIDLTGVNWTPIGSNATPFIGKLDGNSKVVRNLAVTDTTKNNQGLFSVVGAGGEIKNLGIEGANITAADNSGIMAGINSGTISRCYTKGSVSGANYVGGLAGQNSGTINNSYSRAAVSGKDYSGGLAGANSGIVENSYASSTLAPSVFNNYLEFNKNSLGGYIDIPHKAAYVGNQFTLEAWFQWDNTGTNNVNFIMGKGYEQFEIHTGGPGVNWLRFIPIANNNGDSWIDVKNVMQPGWFHVAAVYDYDESSHQATARVYVNGAAQDLWQGPVCAGKAVTLSRDFNTLGYGKKNWENPLVADNLQAEQNNINIGRRTDNSYYFDGKISDVRFWNIARTGEEIRRDKDKVLTGTEPGLAGYWRLNEDSGDAIDSSSNNNKGTLEGDVTRTSEAAAVDKGGLLGENTGTVTDSYYDSEVSGQSDNSGKGIPRTTSEMKAAFGAWDFTNTWGINAEINGGYPYLLSASKDIVSFDFAGLDPVVKGVVDNVAETIRLAVPYGTDLTELTPTITHTGSSVSPASGIANDFSGSAETPVQYTVTAADNSTQDYYVTVSLLDFAAGDGSEGNPYQITKLEHLNNIRNYLDKHFILMNDLDFNDNASYLNPDNKTTWTTGSGWLPMATNGYTPFIGSLNGNEHLINGLYINRNGDSYTGLFGYNGGLIKKLGLTNVNITGTRVGAIAADNCYSSFGTVKGEIESCFVTGNVQGVYDVGGIIGWNTGKVSNSYAVVSAKGTANNVGGIAGRAGIGGNPNTSFVNCFATGRIYGATKDMGGINGINMPDTSVTYTNCYYDSRSTGLSGGYGVGLSTIQMKQQASFSGFDFEGTWGITNSVTFPYLRWQSSQTDQAWPAFKDTVPAIDNIKAGSMDLHLETDENGTAHYVVMDANFSQPAAAEIKNGTGSGGIAVISHGSISITADNPIVESIVNSPAIRTQKVYIVTEDSTGSLQIVPDSFIFVNAVAPVIATDLTNKTTIEGTPVILDATATVPDGGEISYVWYRADDADKTNAQVIAGAAGATYNPPVASAGEFYYYCVITNTNNAVTGAKTAVTASAVSKVTVLEAVPGAPIIQSAIAGDRHVNITWSEVEGSTGYKIFSSTASGAYDDQPDATVTDAVYSYNAAGLQNGTTYYFVVKATNAGGDSPNSNEISATPQVPAPGAPVLESAIAGDKQIDISWSGVSGSTGYKIFSSTASGAYDDQPDATVTDAVYSYNAAGLENGTAYYFVIKATNEGGDSDYSNEISATPVSVPGAPTNVTAEAGNRQVIVSFTAPSDNGGSPITGYTVTSSPGNITETSAGTTITVADLSNGTAYTFTVKAVNIAGTGPASAASNAVTPFDSGVSLFTLSYDLNGGSGGAPASVTQPAGSAVTVGQGGDLARTNCTFTGWNTAADGSGTAYQPDDALTLGNGDITLYAQWRIDAAGISGLTAPAAGAEPAALGSLAAGHAEYTVTGLTWQNGDGTAAELYNGKFKAGMDYKAVVELTAKADTQFRPLTPTVSAGTAEAGTVGSNTAGNKLTFTVSFPATAPKAVTKIEIKNQPSDLIYAEGERLNLAGLEVTLTYNDSSAADAAPADFAANGIAASPANGTILTVTGHNRQPVTLTCGSYTAATDKLTVNPYRPESEDSGEDNTPPAPTAPTKPENTGVDLLVNGKTEKAATAMTFRNGDQTVTTVVVDDNKVEEKLQAEGNNATVTIPVKSNADVVVGQLSGQTVKQMETKEAVLEIKTENVTYTLPASQINIDNVSEQIGKQAELKDIKVNVAISQPSQDTAKLVEETAGKNSYQLVVKPIDFSITCSNGSKTVEVSRFNGYVERTIAIPEGIDPSRISTGIVLNSDGTFSHVPTTITIIDGRYYARINSLTNSTYSIIWSPKTFADAESHWAKEAINDMASRLVISGGTDGLYHSDEDVTRAEFAAIVVRALGLMRPGAGKDVFDDVAKKDWYYDAISIAYEYGIISGYNSGKFGPMDCITREQAMTMIARAMKITRLDTGLTDSEASKILGGLNGGDSFSVYAKTGIAACVKNGIISGGDQITLVPKDNITRAEVAVLVRRLLQKSKLI
ncbi:MAG TPA: S-layer homology domain-containing protein [Clostridia bacterium]|nr:S-layer homology domain-containing protein [Clostridia bacterium]